MWPNLTSAVGEANRGSLLLFAAPDPRPFQTQPQAGLRCGQPFEGRTSVFGELDNLETEAPPSVSSRRLSRQCLLAGGILGGSGVAPEHLGFTVISMRDDPPIMRERRGGRADRFHVAVGHRRGQVAFLLRHRPSH